MTAKGSAKLLIIEDDIELAEMLCMYFERQGYAAVSYAWGEQGLKFAIKHLPDLVILDVHLPDMDGFEVCRQLRKRHNTQNIPVIFLTERRERESRMHGLGLGVVDYLTKPFDIEELRLRVRNILQRAREAQAEHPISGFLDANTILGLARESEADAGPYAAIVVELQGYWSYRELYGFVAADEVLRIVSETLRNTVQERCHQQGFCGHIADPLFLLLVPQHAVKGIQDRIVSRFHGRLEYFYSASDRRENASTQDRLNLSIAIAIPTVQPIDSVDDLLRLAYPNLAA
nr:response regulator [Anaerolineae bacterium]